MSTNSTNARMYACMCYNLCWRVSPDGEVCARLHCCAMHPLREDLSAHAYAHTGHRTTNAKKALTFCAFVARATAPNELQRTAAGHTFGGARCLTAINARTHACMHAFIDCVHACVRARVRVCVCVHVLFFFVFRLLSPFKYVWVFVHTRTHTRTRNICAISFCLVPRITCVCVCVFQRRLLLN